MLTQGYGDDNDNDGDDDGWQLCFPDNSSRALLRTNNSKAPMVGLSVEIVSIACY